MFKLQKGGAMMQLTSFLKKVGKESDKETMVILLKNLFYHFYNIIFHLFILNL